MEHVVVGTGAHHIIALHGWFGSARGWGSFPQYLDTTTFTYHFMDYRGYGARRDEPGEFTLEEISGDVRRLVDEAGLSRYTLLGHSMGGAAALRVLADDTERVVAVIGVSPVCAMPVSFGDNVSALFRDAPDDPDKRAMIVNVTTGTRNSAVWVDQIVRHSVENSTPQACRAYLDAWTSADFADELRGLHVPVLLVPGRFDPALGEPAMRQTWCRLFPHAALATVDNAGHYPMDEAPVYLATIVEDFLRNVITAADVLTPDAAAGTP